jgi:hypothetical protein
MMIDGPILLAVTVGILAAIWIIVLYGSTYFGPR